MGLKIHNATGERATVDLYGVIGDDFGGVTANQFRQELSAIPAKTPIDLHIHSEGGSFFDGVAIHSQLKQRKGGVNVIVDGLAASAASLIAMAGSTIEMADHSWMMIHEAWGATTGRADDFRAAADRLDATNAEIVSIYSGRWTGSEDELRTALDSETWLNAEQSVAAGLADSISESLAIAACIDTKTFNYHNIPQDVLNPKRVDLSRYEAICAQL